MATYHEGPLRPWQANMRLVRASIVGTYYIAYEMEFCETGFTRPPSKWFYWHPCKGWVTASTSYPTPCFSYDNAWHLMSTINAPPTLPDEADAKLPDEADAKSVEANREKPVQVGLTADERWVLARLADAWVRFVALPTLSMNDTQEMLHTIHAAQNIVLSRVAVRINPDFVNNMDIKRG